MNFSFKKLIGISSASAEVVDNHLVLAFPEALEPIVWRMSLEKIGSAAFEVKQDSDSDQTKLVLKPKKGTAEIIAPFATKKEAVDALMIASKALQHTGINNTKPVQKKTTVQNSQQPNNSHETVIVTSSSATTEKQKWVIALIGAFLVIGLYYYLTTLIPETVQDLGTTASSTVTPPISNPTQTSGVPVSADDFLGGF